MLGARAAQLGPHLVQALLAQAQAAYLGIERERGRGRGRLAQVETPAGLGSLERQRAHLHRLAAHLALGGHARPAPLGRELGIQAALARHPLGQARVQARQRCQGGKRAGAHLHTPTVAGTAACRGGGFTLAFDEHTVAAELEVGAQGAGW